MVRVLWGQTLLWVDPNHVQVYRPSARVMVTGVWRCSCHGHRYRLPAYGRDLEYVPDFDGPA